MSQRILTEPPVIAPLAASAERPLWSVMIPVYNGAELLPATLQAVLVQAEAEKDMQIEVVDDASTDADVEKLVREVGKGRIAYYRQPENMGSLRNFATCLNRAQGHYIHLLHADDKVLPGYYTKMTNLLAAYPQAGAAFCRFRYIDEAGKLLWEHDAEPAGEGLLENFLPRLAERQRIQYCAMAVRREVYEQLGGFYGVTYGEDWEMWLRIAAAYPIAYTPETLAEYRMHYNSISGNAYVSGKNMADLQWVMNKAAQYLKGEERRLAMQEANRFYAHYALRVANRLWHKAQHKQGVKSQIAAALRMHRDASLYWKVAKLYTKMWIGWV